MATIEGNEIALRNVFDDMVPKSRDNSTAKVNNDSFPPFFTQTFELTNGYGTNLAPGWVYGMTFEGPGIANQNGPIFGNPANLPNSWAPIFVSWGATSGNGQSEAVLYPGQTIEFPRGARRVFVRSSIPPFVGSAIVALTWKTDLWARKTDSSGTQNQVQLGIGNGVQASGPGLPQGGIQFDASPRSSFLAVLENTASVGVTWQVLIGGTGYVLDTSTIAPGVTRTFHYGPGIGTSLPAGQQGHNFAFPQFITVQITPNAPIIPGESVGLSWWAR